MSSIFYAIPFVLATPISWNKYDALVPLTMPFVSLTPTVHYAVAVEMESTIVESSVVELD